MRKDRDYKQEAKWASSEEQKKRRAGRNKARRLMMEKGLVKKGDGKEVNHKNKNTLDNRMKNLEVLPAKKNRSIQ